MAGHSVSGLVAKGVPPLSKIIFILRIVVIVLSVAVLVAAAYNLSLYGGYASFAPGYSGPAGLAIFVVILTVGTVGGVWAVEAFAPQAYFRIAVIIAYILAIIFWLSAWAWAASVAGLFLKTSCTYGYGCYGPGEEGLKLGGSLAAAAALGALNWIFLIVITFFYIKAFLANPEGSGVTSATNNAELGAVKHEAITPPVQQQQYVPPPQGYEQQQPQQQYGQYPPQQQQAYPPQQQPYPAA